MTQQQAMTLKQAGEAFNRWLRLRNLGYSEFSRLIPCARPYPWALARGHAKPSFRMACRIEQVTGGEVPRTNWYPATGMVDAVEDNRENKPIDLDEVYK